MSSKGNEGEEENVRTGDTASRSDTSGFGDMSRMFSEDTERKGGITIKDLLKDRESFMKEQLKISEELRKSHVEGYKDMINEMRHHFQSFLDIAEKKLSTVLIEPQFASTPAQKDEDKYRLPDPLQKRDQHAERDDNRFHGSFLQETPENGGVKPKKKNESTEERERHFDAELRIIEERETNGMNGPQSRGQGGPSQTGGTGRRGDETRTWESGMSWRSSMMDSQGVPRAKLPTYDGKEEFDVFIVPFERMARRYNWSEQETIDRIYECLKGRAMWFLCSLPKEMLCTFAAIREALMKRFGRKDPPATVRRMLSEIRQKQESNEEFGEEIRRLVTRAYPGVDVVMQDQLAAEAFLKGYKNTKIAYDVLNKKPTTLNEALEMVTFQEHNFKATIGRPQDLLKRDNARRVSWIDEIESDEDVNVRRMNSQAYTTMDDSDERLRGFELKFAQEQEKRLDRIEQLFDTKAENKGNCFNCQGSGHFARNCPKRTRSPSPGPTFPAQKDINVARVANGGKAMKVPVSVNGIDTYAVIDTGADATIVSEKVATEAGIIVPEKSTSFRLLNAINDSEMIAIGGVTATIQLANHVYNWKVFVAPVRDPILLGLDFMKFINAIIYTGQGDVAINGDIITSTCLDEDRQNANSNIMVDNNIITPAIGNEIFLGRVVNPFPNRNSFTKVFSVHRPSKAVQFG